MKENKTIIKFADYDYDDVSITIEVDAELTNGIVDDLRKAVNKIIKETKDWQFDETVFEACELVLKPLGIFYSTIAPDYEILM